MEGIIILVIIYYLFSMFSKKNAKTANEGKSASRQQSTAAQQSAPKSEPKKPQKATKPKAPIVGEGVGTLGGSLGGTLGGRLGGSLGTPYQPIQHRMEEAVPMRGYKGSLGVASTEGMDLCDPSLHHDGASIAGEDSISENEIKGTSILDTSAQGVLRGIVMSEILMRPSNRKWGRH